MSAPAFTPGPWKVTSQRVGHRQRQRAIYGAIAPGHYPQGVLAHTMGSRTEAMNDANAALIAAAPELYDALNALLHRLSVPPIGLTPEELAELSAFITSILAKARGEA